MFRTKTGRPGILVDIFGALLCAALMVLFFFRARDLGMDGSPMTIFVDALIFFAACAAIIFLKELMRALLYKIWFSEKPTFYISLSGVRCCLAHLYIHKWLYILISLLPVFLTGLGLGVAMLFVRSPRIFIIVSWLFATQAMDALTELVPAVLLLIRYAGIKAYVRDGGRELAVCLPTAAEDEQIDE